MTFDTFRISMKVKDSAQSWPGDMYGREFTVYIFQYNEIFGHETDATLKLAPSDERSAAFWWDFIDAVEKRFAEQGVRSRGCAVGDLAVGAYASLRNESFVRYDASYWCPRAGPV